MILGIEQRCQALQRVRWKTGDHQEVRAAVAQEAVLKPIRSRKPPRRQQLLRRPQHPSITQLKPGLKLARFKALLPNAQDSRATRAYLHENGRSIAHLTSAKTAGPLPALKPL